MKTFEIIENDLGIIEKVLLNSGEVFETALELEAWCKENKEKLYGENVHHLMVAVDSIGIKKNILGSLKNNLTARMKIGKSTFVDVKNWNLDIKADERSLNKIKEISGESDYILSSPAAAVNNDFYKEMKYNEAIKRSLWAPLAIEGYLCSSKYPSMGFKPAYTGGLLSCPALPNRIYKNVNSYDVTSAYPYAALTTNVPMGESIRLEKEQIKQIKIIKGELNIVEESGFIGLFKFKNVRRKGWVKSPLLNKDERKFSLDAEFDRYGLNYASEVVLALCPADLKTFWLQYSYSKYEIKEMTVHQLGKIPTNASNFIKKMYDKKNSEEKGSIEREKAKTALNTIVGLWGSDPLSSMIKKTTENGIVVHSYEGEIEEKFLNYSGEKTKVGSSAGKPRTWDFRWAVYVVAEVRLRMCQTEKELYENGFNILYMDTDCVKFEGNNVKAEKFIEKLNNRVLEKMNYKGIGLWTNESEECVRAVFRGVKVYFTEDKNGNRINTVSGVEKEDVKEFNKFSLEELSNINRKIKVEITRRAPAKIKENKFGASIAYAKRNLIIEY